MEDEKNAPQEVDNHSSWRITLTVMFIAQFLSGMGFSFIFPFLPFYFRHLGVKTESGAMMWIGWSSLVFGITMAVSAPIWGVFADRYGRKIMVLRSMFAGSIILGLMGVATNPWHLMFLRFFQGMTTGTVSASITLVSSVTPSANLGFSLGLMQTAVLLGSSAGPLMGGVLADNLGFRIPCGLAAIMLFIGAIVVIFWAIERFVPPRNNKIEGFKTMVGILKTPGFLVIMAIFFLVYMLNTMFIPILPFYIEKLSGDPSKSATLTGIFVGAFGLLSGISAPLFGKLGDRIGHIKILITSLVLAGLFSIPQAMAHSVWVLFIERCLMGLAAGGIIPSVNTLVSNSISRDKVGSAFGLTASVTCLGIGAGPLIGSTLASLFGLRLPFVIMGILALLISLSVYKMAHHHTHGIAPAQNNN
ncbi:MFS transporter [bacterium]|nr:MFS transporter [bacterium]